MPTSQKINVSISHTSPLVAAGLAASLAPFFSVNAAEQDVGQHAEEQPDVLLVDHPGALAMMAQHLARQKAQPWQRQRPLRCVIVTHALRGWRVREAMEHGIQGYVSTDCELPALFDAVRSVHAGRRYLCSSASACIAESLAQEPLTPREMDVLLLISEGLDNKSISARLHIALGTVKSHVKAVLDKLDASSRTQAAATAHQRGLVRSN